MDPNEKRAKRYIKGTSPYRLCTCSSCRKKHPNFEYRLNADALTKKAILRDMHPSLQAALDKAGIKATVYQKKSGDGKTVPLTVKQLKEITNKTGVVIDHSLTVEELATILSKNIELSQKVDVLTTANAEHKNKLFILTICFLNRNIRLTICSLN